MRGTDAVSTRTLPQVNPKEHVEMNAQTQIFSDVDYAKDGKQVASEKSEGRVAKADKVSRPDKVERPEKLERPEKVERPERAGK